MKRYLVTVEINPGLKGMSSLKTITVFAPSARAAGDTGYNEYMAYHRGAVIRVKSVELVK